MRPWSDTTLSEELGLEGADADDLYAAMDRLVARQERIDKKLSARHFHEGCGAPYDAADSRRTGTHCPLAGALKGVDILEACAS